MKKIILALFFLTAALFAETSVGITIILDSSESLVGLDDPMLEKLESALKYTFPIIVSYKLFAALEVQMDEDFTTKYPEFIVQHQGSLVLLVHKSTQQLLDKALNTDTGDLGKKLFTDDIRAIFGTENSIAWHVYLTGHGSKDRTIAGISVKEFKDFLNFLNTKVLTRFLVYSTCYGGGCNKNNIKPDSKGYHFPIIAIGAAETVTVATQVDLGKFFNELFRIESVNKHNHPSSEDYYKILRSTGFITEDVVTKGELDIYNIPQILEAGTTSFKFLKPPTNETVLISDAELIEGTLFTVPGITQAIIIDRKSNNITLSIDRPMKLPNFIVQEPGDYYIQALMLPQTSEKDFIPMFELKKQRAVYTISFGRVELKDAVFNNIQVKIDGEKVTLLREYHLDSLYKQVWNYFSGVNISVKIM